MGTSRLPRVRLKVDETPPRGAVFYQPIPEMVEFTCIDRRPQGVHTLALGRVALALDCESGELVGLQCYVKTGKWKREEEGPPLETDAEGVMFLELPGDDDTFAFLPAEPRFLWHEASSSLRISLAAGSALFFKVASCLVAGVDREGYLTDIWLTGLDLALE